MADLCENRAKVLSISVAAYNAESTLRKALSGFVADRAVRDRTEVIIVNDGSTDATGAIAHEYAAAYPDTVIVIDQQNGGYGSTINASLRTARGTYYKLVDGDDWVDPEYLGQFIDYLSQTGVDVVVSPYYEVRKDRTLVDSHPEIPSEGGSLDRMDLAFPFFRMHEITVRTETLRRVGKQITEHCFYTDTEYDYACFQGAETVARFDRPVYCYRMGDAGQSMSLAGIRKHFRDMIRVSLSVIRMHRDAGLPAGGTKARILENYVEHIILYTVYGILALQDRKQARWELREYEQALRFRYPEEYRISSRRKFLHVARYLRYRPFELFRRYALTKYE